MSIAYGIAVIFVYWSLHSFSISIGYGEFLPPFAAAWTANIVFAVFVVISLKRIRH